MNFGFRMKLGAGVLAAILVAGPILVAQVKSVHAQSNEGGGLFGKKKPKKKSDQALPPAQIVGKVTTETAVVAEKKFAPMLSESSVAAMQKFVDRYEQIIADGGFPKVPNGSFKKGKEGPAIAALNKRLFLDGYLRAEGAQGEFAARMTSATVEALTRFQRNMGLSATGQMDGATLAALNVTAEKRLATIRANIPRLETYGKELGDRYLVVNVPSQQIEAVSNGRVYSRHNAIVGRPERPTPVVMAALSDVNFNPYWNAPPSIVERDIFPKLRSGSRILDEMNIRVFQGFGGPEVDPRKVNWRNAVADDYHFRQEPGPGNAMATAKINFPSPFGIYLHDTPEQQLFKSGQRLYSSGCVRVENMSLLAEWVLNGQDGIDSTQISALKETLEQRDVKLTTPPQLRVTYLTAWPLANTVAFRPDVYGLDGTGFTVGQPMPEGEVAEDGQRFVLKPIPRKAAAVEAAEAEGVGLFGTRSRVANGKRKARPLFIKDEQDGVNDDVTEVEAKKKPPFAVKKKAEPKGGKVVVKQAAKDKKKAGKDVPGLFDWATYRKEGKVTPKAKTLAADKKSKKKLNPKKSETEVAAADPKAKLDPKKKVTPATDKKAEKVATKPVDNKAKKLAKSKPISPGDDAKKVADNCKSDAAGKLPKGCKAPAPKKP